MRQLVAALGWSLLAGCSLIYNPSNIPSGDGGHPIDADKKDAEVILDVNPDALDVMTVTPATLDEGRGDGSGRPTVLVLVGNQIASGAEVTVASHDTSVTAMVTVGTPIVAEDGNMLAVPVTCSVDRTLAAGASTALDITVTQDGRSQTLTSAVVLVGHDELEGSGGSGSAGSAGETVALATGSANVYSIVNYAGAITAADTTNPLVIESMSSFDVTGSISVAASGATGGPGGFAGGGAGAAGGGSGGGASPSGNAGFATTGPGTGGGAVAGDLALSTFKAPNRGNGGGGGNALTGISGGGGGGSLELIAGGGLTVASIKAGGGAGAAGTLVASGGGGSGGVVLLRAGTTIGTATAIAIDGGLAGGSTTSKGSPGRVRTDSQAVTSLAGVTAGASIYSAPMVVTSGTGGLGVITKNPLPTVNLIGTPSTTYTFYTQNPAGLFKNIGAHTMGAQGNDSFALTDPLTRGTNQLCAAVQGASMTSTEPEATNCIALTYVFDEKNPVTNP